MESFFERVEHVGGWPPGRKDLHWHVLPSPAEAEGLLSLYRDRGLMPRGMSPVPDDGLHCTLLHAMGVGADDIDLGAVVDDVRERVGQRAPFTLTFDRPAIGAMAVEISGWPGRLFGELVGDVTAVMRRHAGTEWTAAASRYPHISLAYTSKGAKDVSAADLREALAAIDGPLAQQVQVDAVHLVAQWHDGAAIRWEQLATVALKGGMT
ncbi:2'-5' RNA ligase family protein [Streptomyces venezuelae]|uniref:2'-5' RNA ligase family protein n=1 Tax=Streptomyces venezuelae TaxID=54571 RepID=A0A5P2BA68_STRVZ|nr:hypothetical protein [Streptomyces venezuelae]QES27314.1 hypothetical protein DEJ47_13360 [Streptomyces venezuelae]